MECKERSLWFKQPYSTLFYETIWNTRKHFSGAHVSMRFCFCETAVNAVIFWGRVIKVENIKTKWWLHYWAGCMWSDEGAEIKVNGWWRSVRKAPVFKSSHLKLTFRQRAAVLTLCRLNCILFAPVSSWTLNNFSPWLLLSKHFTLSRHPQTKHLLQSM